MHRTGSTMDNEDAIIPDMNTPIGATSAPETKQFDTKGIPLDIGNRHARRAMAKQNRREGLPEDAHAKFEKEPIWRAMEKVMKHLKEWYALNGKWVFADKEAMAVLNGMRVDHEKREEEIRAKVAEAREAEHRNIDKVFARVEDKKILQNQLKSMKEEFSALTKLATIRSKVQKQKAHG